MRKYFIIILLVTLVCGCADSRQVKLYAGINPPNKDEFYISFNNSNSKSYMLYNFTKRQIEFHGIKLHGSIFSTLLTISESGDIVLKGKCIKRDKDVGNFVKEALNKLDPQGRHEVIIAVMGMVSEETIDKVLSEYIIKWMEEDKHSLPIGTLRRKELAQAIRDKIVGEGL